MEILAILLIVVILAGIGAWLFRGYLLGDADKPGLFGAARERRLGVSESITIDGRRKLLLIVRDDVEHLVMTGGPIDIVIEQGISASRRSGAEVVRASLAESESAAASGGFGRAARPRIQTPPTLETK